MNVSEKRRTWKDMAIYLLPLLHWNNLKSFYPLIFVDLGTLPASIHYLARSLACSAADVFLPFLHFAHFQMCTARCEW